MADALRALPPVPPEAQWANFIKNHDEATLDRLTDAERQEVFAAFAPDESMRLYGRGIRRRFASMVNGDRRRLELAYSLLFSLPGTPVLFYGEEIGMADNPDIPDRGAVRNPLQWADQPGGGFTTADERKLPRPLRPEGPFGYGEVNVREQRRDPDSFLNWTEKAIRTRKEWPEFGWGEWRILGTRNPHVLAHVATWDGASVLALHNFGDAPAKVTVRIPEEGTGGRWQHIFGRGDEDPEGIEGDTFSCELGPYGYHWYGRREGV